MGNIYGDRVQETFTTTGTGTISLGGAVAGYQAFSAVLADTNTCYYAATDGTNWEVGVGTFASSGDTLARTTILASSNSGSAVNWSAGTKNIWLDFPAVAAAMAATPPLGGIINGDMSVAQRGTSFTGLTGTTATYTLDRWFAWAGGTASVSVSQQSAVASNGFNNVLRVGRANSDTHTVTVNIAQILETLDCYKYQGQKVTLSFYARSGANFSSGSSNLNIVVETGTAADEGAASYIAGTWTGNSVLNNSSQAITSTLTRYSVTFTVGATAKEIIVQFYYTPVGTAGAADYFEVTGVQLEPTAIAGAYNYTPYEQNLQRCLRYYQRYTTSGAVSCAIAIGQTFSTTAAAAALTLPVPMRVTPTLTQSGVGSWTSTGTAANGTLSLNAASVATNVRLDMASASYTAAGNATMIYVNGSTAFIALSAEL